MGAQRSTDFEVMLHYLRRKRQELKRDLGVLKKDPMTVFERESLKGQIEVVGEIIQNVENRIAAQEDGKTQTKQDKVGYKNDRWRRQRTYSPTCT